MSKECRICFNNEEEWNDRLIVPCDCTGTAKYIHQSCLELCRLHNSRDHCSTCLAPYALSYKINPYIIDYSVAFVFGLLLGFFIIGLFVLLKQVDPPVLFYLLFMPYFNLSSCNHCIQRFMDKITTHLHTWNEDGIQSRE